MLGTNPDLIRGFQSIKTLDVRCERHPTVFMWEMTRPDNQKVLRYCPECTQEDINQRASDLAGEAQEQIDKLRSYDVFGRESVIPDEVAGATLNNYEIREDIDAEAVNFARRVAMDYLKDGTGNTVIQGPPGVGKSHLAVGIAKGLNDSFQKFKIRKSVVYMPVAELFARMQEAFRYKDSKWEQARALKFLQGVDILILDDLGKESSMGETLHEARNWTQRVLFQLFDNRVSTIVTTNLQGNALKQVYEPSLVDRILKNAKGRMFTYDKATKSKRSGYALVDGK